MRRAMSANLDIRESELVLEGALVDRYEADMAQWLPVFTLNGATSVVKDLQGYATDTSLTTSWDNFGPYFQIGGQIAQPITTFGRVTALRRAASHGVAAREAGVDVRRAQVAGEVYRLYYGILLARELQGLLDDASSRVETARRKVAQLLREGSDKVTTMDRAKIDVYAFELESKRLQASKSARLALAALKRVLNIPLDTPFEIDGGRLRPLPEELPTLDSLRRCAADCRPEIAQAEAGARARRQQLAAAEAEQFPAIFVGAEFNVEYAPGRELKGQTFFHSDGYNSESVRAGLGFKYNVDVGRREARIRRARVAAREMERKLEWARAGIALEVMKAYEDAQEAYQNSRLGRRSSRAGNAWLMQTVERYDLGVASTRDLLEAYGAFAKSRSDYYQTLYDHYIAVAELYRTIGRPIWDLDPENGLTLRPRN
jgi:outer membrane protein TolC